MYRISAKRCIDNRIGAHYNPHKDGCIDGGAGDSALAADSQKSSADAARDSKAATEAKLVECRDILFANAIVTQDDSLVRSMRHRMRANKRDTENAATECNLVLQKRLWTNKEEDARGRHDAIARHPTILKTCTTKHIFVRLSRSLEQIIYIYKKHLNFKLEIGPPQ